MEAAQALDRTQQRRRRGRPARLTIQDIIQATRQMGLSTVTLKDVADRLGVTQAALYRYVDSREELLTLAAFDRALERQMPPTADAHWSEIARGYAYGLFDLLVAEPQLIQEIMNGTLGPDAEIDFIERFIGMLQKQGFSAADAVQVHHSVAMLALGAAAGAVAVDRSYRSGPGRAATIREVLARRPADSLPGIRSAMSVYADDSARQWHRALDTLLAGVAWLRRETLPTSRPALTDAASAAKAGRRKP